jgi:intracellular sulfur oxidation DsrE/DsrF family protein
VDTRRWNGGPFPDRGKGGDDFAVLHDISMEMISGRWRTEQPTAFFVGISSGKKNREDLKMKRNGMALLNLFMAIMLLGSVPTASAEETEGIMSIQSVKMVFDERESNPYATALHLKLVHQTYKDLAAMKKEPAIVVVFMGPSVKLVSKNREGFSQEDYKYLDEIADTVSAMSKDGIKSEICLTAVKYFKVDPASVLPEIKRVGNGWISSTVYQAQGYSLVPVY